MAYSSEVKTDVVCGSLNRLLVVPLTNAQPTPSAPFDPSVKKLPETSVQVDLFQRTLLEFVGYGG